LEHAPGLSTSFCEVARGGDVFIARTVCGSIIVVKKVREGRCGVYGVVGAGGRGHERPCCRNSTVVGQNRGLGALCETSVLNFQTGGRVVAECASVSAVAFVPATRRARSCAVALRRRGAWGGGGAGANVWVYLDRVGRGLRGHGCERLGARRPHVGAALRGGWWAHGM